MEKQGPRHPTRPADALVAASRRRFVGRSSELAVFEALLGRSEPVGVLWLSGQGGVGKTALMQAWAGHAQQSGWRTVRLDGRTAPLSPQACAAAVESASEERSDAAATNLAIFIDTYERLTPLGGWLREQYLPSLPSQTLITIASRQLPGVEWRTDPGWAAALRVLPLRNFRPEESREYLSRRGFPEEQHEEVLGFTHGNPLALSLLTELYRLQPERFTVRHPDVIQARPTAAR